MCFQSIFISRICSDNFKILSRELKVESNVYDIIKPYMKYKNDHLKIIKDENDSKFNNYRKIDEEEMEKYINKKLGELPILQFFEKNYVQMIFCGISMLCRYIHLLRVMIRVIIQE